ncbi:hypothetical protein JB92DRAFT_3051413 [Gautieria morchelliformis]|nr:hypothetical protein JB92DRAFT_3051413 [Gautieria morchelliformis]
MGFCRRCGEIVPVQAARCKCGGSAVGQCFTRVLGLGRAIESFVNSSSRTLESISS